MLEPLEARALAGAIAAPAEVVQRKGNGHAGTAMALAPLAHALFQRVLRHDPADPDWPGRDRLVLSAGHASLLLYVQEVLTGYGLEVDDLARSRRLGSRTPGHPELGITPGVEMSTGPLGQGFASAVGMAAAALHEAARFGGGSEAFEHTVFVIAGDGCMQEGVTAEAASLAGSLGLDGLVAIWDDNRVTIDGPTPDGFSDEVRGRFAAAGWRVLEADDPDDVDALEGVLLEARERTGRPTLVALRTVIGAPAPNRAGTAAAHAGGLGEDEVAAVKEQLGFARDAALDDLLPPEVLAWGRRARGRGARLHAEWDEAMARWRDADPGLAAEWDAFRAGDVSGATAALDAIPRAEAGAEIATRVANGRVIETVSRAGYPLWGGSADLSGSTNVAIAGDAFSAADPRGAFIRFGVREHAMAAFLSGVALAGPWRPYGSTYLVFSDYQRPAIRLAALMGLGVVYVWTHDSVAVGEDGPTHQPVEQLASLRTVPGLAVVRPADANETVDAWGRILASPEGPVALVLGRQAVPVVAWPSSAAVGVRRGAYVLHESEGWEPGYPTIVATGSEVALAMSAADVLESGDVPVRVVSMPCVEWFRAEPADYRGYVVDRTGPVVAVEAGVSPAWYEFADAVVGVDAFGESGSGPELMRLRGLTVDNVVLAVESLVADWEKRLGVE